MKNRKALILLAILSLILMVYGSTINQELLLIPVIKKPYLPFGTITAWLALISISALPFLLDARLRGQRNLSYQICKYVGTIGLGVAIFWPFFGRLIAGNWNFTFSPQTDFIGSVEAGLWFSRYTMLIAVLASFVLLAIGVLRIYGLLKAKREKTRISRGK